MTPSPSSPPASIYIAGLFAMGYTEFYIFLIPLYALSLGMSAGEVGMLVGGRSLLAVFLSIHVGVLMDRLGTRRVTLFFVLAAVAAGDGGGVWPSNLRASAGVGSLTRRCWRDPRGGSLGPMGGARAGLG